MLTTRTALAGLALAAALNSGGLDACHKEQTGTGPSPAATSTKPTKPAAAKPSTPAKQTKPAAEPDARDLDANGEMAWSCDMNDHAVNVRPNTARNRKAAEESCKKMGKALDEAPWPDGVSVVPLPPELVEK